MAQHDAVDCRAPFSTDSELKLGGSFSSRPDYASKTDEYVRSENVGHTTYVLYRNVDGMFGKFHEYVVRAQDGDFKIVDIAIHYGDPAVAFVDSVAISEIERGCSVMAELPQVPKEEASLDHNRNFTDRTVRDDEGNSTQTKVSAAGTLTTTSGILSIWDFGMDNDDVRPLARSVSPGRYPVDRVTAFGRNAAVRVRFNDNLPVEWRLASRAGQSSDTVGVDAGCICIVDYAGYSAMTPRSKAEALALFKTIERPAAAEFSLTGTNVGFACESGWGDGSYPVYWGLDAQGQTAQLVVDFSVLVTDQDGTYRHL